MDVLFLTKRNEIYGNKIYTRRSSGLYNSTNFIVTSLIKEGFSAAIVEVNDNNDIDREVSKFDPSIVVIEALWVVPDKFGILQHLHPDVSWFIHLHSDMPFLAIEGIAIDWIYRCSALGVGIIANSQESYDALKPVVQGPGPLVYLPNVYAGHLTPPNFCSDKTYTVDVGCFGAIRPLKNQLLQGLAAIQFAKEIGCFLRFHVNDARVETGGEPVMKNLRQLFQTEVAAQLVEHPWYEPDDFIDFMRDNLDIGMQVSLTETFNVVSADYLAAGIPIVVSKEVKWASSWSTAIDNSLPDIVAKMHRAYQNGLLVKWNQYLLRKSARVAIQLWSEFVLEET